MNYVVIDTELTGLDAKKDSIISLGAIRMTGSRIALGETFSALVHPNSRLKTESVLIHGITPGDLASRPGIDAALTEFLEFCGADIIVGHCLAVDLPFINRELKRTTGRELENPVLDTRALFACLKRRLPDHAWFRSLRRECDLYDIARKCGIPVAGAHNAVMDAFIAAQVFQRFIPLLTDLGFETTGKLLKVGSPSREGDVFRAALEISNL